MNDFDKIMDECIDRINRGEDINSCLADYPDYTEQLRPLLEVIVNTRESYSFTPSHEAKNKARERFNLALEDLERKREERPPLFTWLQGQSRIWATATAVIVIAIVSYFGVRQLTFPVESVVNPESVPVAPSSQPESPPVSTTQPTPVIPESQPEISTVVTVAQPNSDGNFVFLISDDVNAIEDFESVNVSILKISLLGGGKAGQIVEFEPELGEVDLTLVKGDKTQEIWRGDVPEGEYSSVSIQVSEVLGVLKETGEIVEIKLPSQKLRISKGFQISADSITTFTYDLTVVAAGSSDNTVKYILKPQVDQSGADYNPIEPKEKTKKEKSNDNKPVSTKKS